ncbi:hypothetical protein Hte_003904 [Hypoxylon texense]
MCVETWRTYRQCKCQMYLSTYICNQAQGRSHGADNVMTKTRFLPDKPPKVQTSCRPKRASLPSDAKCPECARQGEEMRAAGISAAARSASSASSVLQGETFSELLETIREKASVRDKGNEHQRLKESPGPQAAERVRNSLLFLEQKRNPTR